MDAVKSQKQIRMLGEGELQIKKMASQKLGVMVVGAGSVAGHYLDCFHQHSKTELVAVADTNAVVRDEVSKKYGLKRAVSNYRDLLTCDEIQLVVVCTPHYLHHQIVIDSLKAGKHVFCEKPIAVSLREADDMINVAIECRRKLFITLNMRFDACAFTIREIVKSGNIGRVFMARSAYLGYEVARLADPNNWKGDLKKAGGGVLLDGGYHIIDVMNSCLGQACFVQAAGGRFVIEAQNKGEDNISLLVEYADGSVANLQVSFTACSPGCHKEPTLFLEHEFWGTKGSISAISGWDPIRGLKRQLEVLNPAGACKNIDLNTVSCLDMKEHYIDCLFKDEKPMVTALDARNALAVVEAAYESIRMGRKVPVKWRTEE